MCGVSGSGSFSSFQRETKLPWIFLPPQLGGWAPLRIERSVGNLFQMAELTHSMAVTNGGDPNLHPKLNGT